MFSSRGTVRYEERGQGYRDVEKVGKHWSRGCGYVYKHMLHDIGKPRNKNTQTPGLFPTRIINVI